MPAPALVTIIAAALIVAGLAAALTMIVVLLLRISGALSDAEARLGAVPEQLSPLGPAVGRLTGALTRLRAQVDGDYVTGDG